MSSLMMTTEAEYRDRQFSTMLALLGAFIGFGVGIAIGAVYGPGARIVTWGLAAIALMFLLRATSLVVTIDREGVRVGRAHIPWDALGPVEMLDRESLRLALGQHGHPDDFRRVRSAQAGMRIPVIDPDDPHRSWVVSLNKPITAAAVIRQLGR